MKKPKLTKTKEATATLARCPDPYAILAGDIAALLDEARRQAARSVNAIMTATYWEIGRRIVGFEQSGKPRAEYGEELLIRLSQDLTARFGRGFGVDNLQRMRVFFLTYPPDKIYATLSRKSLAAPIRQTLSGKSEGEPKSRKSETLSWKSLALAIPQILSAESLGDYLAALAPTFALSWSHYVRLLSVKMPEARAFYETEALRGGWSVRQLDRQISSLFYERTALSKNKVAMLTRGAKPKPGDAVTALEAEIEKARRMLQSPARGIFRRS